MSARNQKPHSLPTASRWARPSPYQQGRKKSCPSHPRRRQASLAPRYRNQFISHELSRNICAPIQEKPIDDVTVQEVLDRAAVGRSTFYLHFRDKNDLLVSQLEKFLEMMSGALSVRKEESHRVVPVAELFEHIGNQRKIYRALADSGRLNDFFDLAQGYFSRGIEQRLRESKRIPKLLQRELAARASALAGSLLSLLRWWLDRGAKEPPRYMDELFHRIVWSGLQ
jgi:AcrR family transcriptional regulator